MATTEEILAEIARRQGVVSAAPAAPVAAPAVSTAPSEPVGAGQVLPAPAAVEAVQPGPEATQPLPGEIATPEQILAEIQRRQGGDISSFDPDTEWKDVFVSAFENIPESAVEFGKGIKEVIANPVETVQALGGLVAGVVQKAVPGEQEQEKNVDLLVDFMKDRYGSVANMKRTIAKDPVGVLADASSFIIPGGAAIKGAGTATKLKTLTRVGTAIERGGALIEPINALKKTVGVAAPLIPKGLPSKLFESAAKFSTTLSPEKRAKLTRTALDNNVMPTVRGLDRTRSKINVLNVEITDLIDSATEAGQKIPIKRLFRDFRALEKDAVLTGQPKAAQKAIRNIRKQIFLANKQIGRKDFTPAQAQKLKQNIYRETGSYFSKTSQSPAKVQAQQAVARAAKESLEELFPEIKNLNKREGALIELVNELEKSSARISNRDLLGIGVPIKGGAGGSIAGVPGLVGGLTIGLLDTPQVKAKAAVVLDKLRREGVEISPTSGFVRLGITTPERVGIEVEETNGEAR